MRKTSGLPNTAPLGAGLIRSVPGGVFSFGRDGDQARQKSRAAMLCRNTRLRFAFAGANAIEWGKHTSGKACADGGTSAGSKLRFPPRTYLRRGAQSDVRDPLKRGRRPRGVAMAAFEKTCRSGGNIRSMRYFGRLAMDICPLELTWRAKREPIMPNRADHVPHWQCGLGYFSRRGRPATRRDSELARNFETQRHFGRVASDSTWWYFPTQAERRPRATK